MKLLKLMICFVVFAALLPACKAKKKLLVVNDEETCVIDSSRIKELGIFPDSIQNNWYKIKGEAKVELNNTSVLIDVQLRLKPNELIWISLSKAGFPVAKVLLKKDSVFVLDLFHKEYLASNYEALAGKIGVSLDFPIIQSILLGQYIPFQDSTFIWKQNHELVVSNHSKDSVLALTETQKLLWTQWLDCSELSVKKQFIKTPNQEEVITKFLDLDTSTELPLSKHIEVTATKAGVKKLFSTLDYDKIKSSKSLNIPFEIPEDYVEME